MNAAECKREFQTHYQMTSMGAPSLNNYEMSVFLTQAVREIIEEIYTRFEHTEYRKRGLGPLIKEQTLQLTSNTKDYFESIGITAFEALLPFDSYFLFQENVKLKGVNGHVEVIPDDLDEINITVKNSFRKPNKRRVLRTEIGDRKVRLYSAHEITNYKVKYLKKYKPIILSDFSTDPDLMQNETIDGQNKPSMTELPDFLHDKIVKRAVILAVKALRENNLQTQIEV